MKVTVLIPAAGSGTRMGKGTKKQFLLLDGLPILAHTLRRFEDVPEVTEIIPVVPEDEMEHCLKKCVEGSGLKKVRRVVPGGQQRQDSVYNGLKAVDPGTDYVMVHDGVRPFVTPDLIGGLLCSLDGCDGAILAVPSKDTVKEVGRDLVVKKTIDRKSCYMVQTPQVFRYKALMDAFRKAYADGYYGTDEASLVEKYGGKVKVVMGSYVNIKITTPEDMILAEALLRKDAHDKAAASRKVAKA
ncbi:MAG: 2-C-methyl-D-erythritol 4-phosphate cytidylyltransferase [Nitrospirae bacterium]|nr:2-C-methyl-D-erythritol 4-phosphate cytidylyltransferase [Nitrospirota bacterium]